MKARKIVSKLASLTVGGLVLLFSQTAESQSFSEGKNLFQLRESLRGATLVHALPLHRATWNRPADESLSPIFLPRWSAQELPFFCRVEHGFAKKSIVPFKFRLGSVEYVDWLEGKGGSRSLDGRHWSY